MLAQRESSFFENTKAVRDLPDLPSPLKKEKTRNTKEFQINKYETEHELNSFRKGNFFSPSSEISEEKRLGNYIIQGKIGQGAYGIIYRVQSRSDNCTYVAKEIKFTDSNNLREAQHECQLMKELKHRYVTQYIESFVKGNCLYMVMEYCQKGDLADYLARCKIQGNLQVKEQLNLNF
jgi:hypothetical protein